MRAAREALGLTQEQVAEKIGISQRFYAKIEKGETPGLEYRQAISSVLGMRDGAPAAVDVPTLEVEGQVSAGSGDIDQWADVGGHLRFGAKWAAVRVKGDSAYPVVYPDQYALVDYARAVTVEHFDEAAGWDLDDDVVLVRLHNGGALLKRFCFHPPNDFILASVNGGRRSPLVKREDIHCIVPVVGTIYHGADERAPDRWKLKRNERKPKGR